MRRILLGETRLVWWFKLGPHWPISLISQNMTLFLFRLVLVQRSIAEDCTMIDSSLGAHLFKPSFFWWRATVRPLICQQWIQRWEAWNWMDSPSTRQRVPGWWKVFWRIRFQGTVFQGACKEAYKNQNSCQWQKHLSMHGFIFVFTIQKIVWFSRICPITLEYW